MTAKKSKSGKPKLGFFSFSCCEGCQVMLFQLEQDLMQVFDLLDVNFSRLLMERNKLQTMDVAIVEGSIIGSRAIAKLKEIRKKAKFLIAFGACATEGGIPAIRNSLPEAVKRKIAVLSPRAPGVGNVSDFVKVDYNMRGCPVSEQELLRVLLMVANGIFPHEIHAPVCMECKMRETSCLLLKGEQCLGPISNAGCNAPCPEEGFYCNACRGLNEDANIDSLKKLLRKNGLSTREINNLFTIFNSPTPAAGAPRAKTPKAKTKKGGK